jgi:hypothetical protein
MAATCIGLPPAPPQWLHAMCSSYLWLLEQLTLCDRSKALQWLNSYEFTGLTPLGWAVQLNCAAAIAILVRGGADVAKPVSCVMAMTPLQYAQHRQASQCVAALTFAVPEWRALIDNEDVQALQALTLDVNCLRLIEHPVLKDAKFWATPAGYALCSSENDELTLVGGRWTPAHL